MNTKHEKYLIAIHFFFFLIILLIVWNFLNFFLKKKEKNQAKINLRFFINTTKIQGRTEKLSWPSGRWITIIGYLSSLLLTHVYKIKNYKMCTFARGLFFKDQNQENDRVENFRAWALPKPCLEGPESEPVNRQL